MNSTCTRTIANVLALATAATSLSAASSLPVPGESAWIGTYEYEHNWDAEKKVEHFQLKSVTIAPFAEFKGDPAAANWLANEALAKAWKAKMGF